MKLNFKLMYFLILTCVYTNIQLLVMILYINNLYILRKSLQNVDIKIEWSNAKIKSELDRFNRNRHTLT